MGYYYRLTRKSDDGKTLTDKPGVKRVFGAGSLIDGANIMQSVVTTVTLTEILAGKTIVPDQAGVTITPMSYRIIGNGTKAGGSGDLTLTDTAGSPVVITTCVYANLPAGGTYISSEAVTTGNTNGVGLMGPLTAGKGIKIAMSAGLTTMTGFTVRVDYISSQ